MCIRDRKTGAAERRELILNGSIVRTLMMLSFPTLMMSVVQSLMPLSDGLFINNVAGTLVASAVTYSEPIINMMTALAQGLSVAAMAIIGQTFGQGNFKMCIRDSPKRPATNPPKKSPPPPYPVRPINLSPGPTPAMPPHVPTSQRTGKMPKARYVTFFHFVNIL